MYSLTRMVGWKATRCFANDCSVVPSAAEAVSSSGLKVTRPVRAEAGDFSFFPWVFSRGMTLGSIVSQGVMSFLHPTLCQHLLSPALVS